MEILDQGLKILNLENYDIQFRAVQESVRRLQNGKTRSQHGESDQRGRIIWHTQGSGKSLTMVFLVRKLRTLPKLQRFKIVVVTDRIDLQKQLSNTASLTNETVLKAINTEELKTLLRQSSPDLIFATIQKYQQRDEDISDGRGVLQYAPTGNSVIRKVAENSSNYNLNPKVVRLVTETEQFPILNDSEDILVLVDEAHRTQASQLHANLMAALPNCARIGFTGTPILAGNRKRTYEIFGEFIDRYTIKESEADGATVPILYEGRTAEAEVADGRFLRSASLSLDQLFEDMFRERTPQELAAIRAKYATEGNVLEAPKLIAAKAEDMLRHYVETVLPNGFKAQVVATSRLAAVRYQQAFVAAHQKLVAQLESFDPSQPSLDPETEFLTRIYPQLAQIKGLEFASVISSGNNDDPAWKQWSDKSKVEDYINRFKKSLLHPDPSKQDSLAFIIVKSMLLTGFDAPIEQVLYLDRSMQGHELLQAIARVNRTYSRKSCGLVVDYYGVARHLKTALAVYSAEDIQGALISLTDELPKLSDHYATSYDVFVYELPDFISCTINIQLEVPVKIGSSLIDIAEDFGIFYVR